MFPHFSTQLQSVADPRGEISPLKPTKVALFTIIFYNSEKGDIKSFRRRLLLCHNSFVNPTFSLLQWRSCHETWLPNIAEIAPPKVTGWLPPMVTIQCWYFISTRTCAWRLPFAVITQKENHVSGPTVSRSLGSCQKVFDLQFPRLNTRLRWSCWTAIRLWIRASLLQTSLYLLISTSILWQNWNLSPHGARLARH